MNKLAVVSGASAAQTQDLLADAIHAWGLNVSDAGTIAAKFFKIVDLGRATIAEMAPNLGRVAVIAAQVGVNLDELGAAIATTTIKGVKFETASTLIRNVLLKLAKPTEEITALMNSLGYASSDMWIQTVGLGGVLADVEKATQGSATAFSGLFRNIRATTGAMVFSGEGLNTYNKNLKAIGESTLTYEQNVKKVYDSLGILADKAKQKIQAIFVFDTAQPMIQAIADMTNNFEDLVVAVEAGRKIFAALAGSVLPFLVVGLGKVVQATVIMTGTLLSPLNPLIRIGVVAASIYTGLQGLSAVSSKEITEHNRKMFLEWNNSYIAIQDKAAESAGIIQAYNEAAYKASIKPVLEYLRQTKIASNKIGEINKLALKDFNTAVLEQQHIALKGAKGILGASKAAVEELTSEIDALKTHALSVVEAINQTELATDLVGETDILKVISLNEEIERLKKLRAEATDSTTFQALSGQINDATSQRDAIQLKITADPAALEKAYTDAFDLLEARSQEFEFQGDKEGVSATKAEYETLLALYKSDTGLGDVSNSYAGILADIKAVKSELGQAEKNTDLFYNLEDELAGLQKVKAGMASVFQTGRAGDIGEARVKALDEEWAMSLQLAALKDQERDKENSSITKQLDVIHQLEVAFKGLKSFKIEDFKETDKATESYRRQLEYVKQIQAALGNRKALAGIEKQIGANKANTTREAVQSTAASAIEIALNANKNATIAAAAEQKAVAEELSKLNVEFLSLGQKTNILQSQVLPAIPTEQEWGFGSFADRLDAISIRFDVFGKAIAGDLINPLAAVFGNAAAFTKTKVPEETAKQLDNTPRELLAVTNAAISAINSPERAQIFADAIANLNLTNPDAKKAIEIDFDTLNAQGRVDYKDLLDKLSPLEKLVVKLKSTDQVDLITKALTKKDEAQAQVDKVQADKVSFGEQYNALPLQLEGNGIALGSLSVQQQMLLAVRDLVLANTGTPLPAATALPKTFAAANGAQQITYNDHTKITVTAATYDLKRDAEKIGDAVTGTVTKNQRMENLRKRFK